MSSMPRLDCVALVTAAVLIFSSCGRTQPASSNQSSAQKASGTSGTAGAPSARGGGAGAAVPVVTAHVVQKPVAVTIPAVGTVEAVSTVQIKSQVTGQLTASHFKEGDEVRQGQLLFTIDPRPFEAALEQAQAALARDTATRHNQQAEAVAVRRPLSARPHLPRAVRRADTPRRRRRNRRCEVDQAAVEYGAAQPALHAHHGADRRPHRLARRCIRATSCRPTARPRWSTINQVSPIYVTFSVPGRYLARHPAVPGAAPARGRRADAVGDAAGRAAADADERRPRRVARRRGGTVEQGTRHVHRQRGRRDDRHDQAEGDVRRTRSRRCGRACSSRSRCSSAMQPHAVVVPSVAVQTSQQGQYVYVVKPDHTVRAAARHASIASRATKR